MIDLSMLEAGDELLIRARFVEVARHDNCVKLRVENLETSLDLFGIKVAPEDVAGVGRRKYKAGDTLTSPGGQVHTVVGVIGDDVVTLYQPDQNKGLALGGKVALVFSHEAVSKWERNRA